MRTIYNVNLTDKKTQMRTTRTVPLTKEQETIYRALNCCHENRVKFRIFIQGILMNTMEYYEACKKLAEEVKKSDIRKKNVSNWKTPIGVSTVLNKYKNENYIYGNSLIVTKGNIVFS